MSSLTPRIDKLASNKLINGNFDFWQRGTSFSLASATYTADRWLATFGTGGITVSRSTDVPTSSSSRYSLSISGAAAVGANPRIIHRIESLFARTLVGKTVTLKGKFKATDAISTAPLTLSIDIPTTSDAFGAVTNIVSTTLIAAPTQNQWVELSYTFVVPSTAINGLSITLLRSHVVASATTNLFNELMLLEGDFSLSGAMSYIKAGEDPFREFQLCQRYYEKSYLSSVNPGTGSSQPGCITVYSFGVGIPNNSGVANIRYLTSKRTSPTVIIYSYAGTPNQMGNGGGVDVGAMSADFNGESGFRARNSSGGTFAASEFLFHFTADAEL